jgi:hypothetical protein
MWHCRKLAEPSRRLGKSKAVPLRACSLVLVLALPLAARALCTSDRVPQPQAVLERFVSADCEDCWRDPRTPVPAANTVVLDWVVPGKAGDDAPLSAVASREASDRLQALGHPVPERTSAVGTLRSGPGLPLRLAQGDSVNDYVGTTIELKQPGREPWHAWLLLVESLPAGTEGSAVARNLVRNVFRPDWGDTAHRARGPLADARAMQIHEGAKPERLRLLAILQDARGRIRAISRTECP